MTIALVAPQGAFAEFVKKDVATVRSTGPADRVTCPSWESKQEFVPGPITTGLLERRVPTEGLVTGITTGCVFPGHPDAAVMPAQRPPTSDANPDRPNQYCQHCVDSTTPVTATTAKEPLLDQTET